MQALAANYHDLDLPGDPAEDAERLLNPTTVGTSRYRYRGAAIPIPLQATTYPSPADPPGTFPPSSKVPTAARVNAVTGRPSRGDRYEAATWRTARACYATSTTSTWRQGPGRCSNPIRLSHCYPRRQPGLRRTVRRSSLRPERRCRRACGTAARPCRAPFRTSARARLRGAPAEPACNWSFGRGAVRGPGLDRLSSSGQERACHSLRETAPGPRRPGRSGWRAPGARRTAAAGASGWGGSTSGRGRAGRCGR
jgi:hypothetical protein